MKSRMAILGYLIGGTLFNGAALAASLYGSSDVLLPDDIQKIASPEDAYFCILACVVYVAFIVVLGLFVGFNRLEEDK